MVVTFVILNEIIYLSAPKSHNSKFSSSFSSVVTSSIRLAIFHPSFPMGNFLFIYFMPTYMWLTLAYFILSEKKG